MRTFAVTALEVVQRLRRKIGGRLRTRDKVLAMVGATFPSKPGGRIEVLASCSDKRMSRQRRAVKTAHGREVKRVKETEQGIRAIFC